MYPQYKKLCFSENIKRKYISNDFFFLKNISIYFMGKFSYWNKKLHSLTLKVLMLCSTSAGIDTGPKRNQAHLISMIWRSGTFY